MPKNQDKNNYKISKISGGQHQPSKFLIDLKPKEEKKRFSILSKSAELKKSDKKIRPEPSQREKPALAPENEIITSINQEKKYSDHVARHDFISSKNIGNYFSISKLKSLAIFSVLFFIYKIFRTFFRLIFRLSYFTGWLMIFLVKLFFNIFIIAAKPFLFFGEQFKQLKSFLIIKNSSKHKPEKNEEVKFQPADAVKKTSAKKPKINWFLKKSISAFWHSWNLHLSRKSARSAFSFLILISLIIIPIKGFTYYQSLNLRGAKGKVLGVSIAAFSNMVSAGKALSGLDFSGASDSFSRASQDFLAAESQVRGINNVLFSLASLVPNQQMKLASEGKNILAAGGLASELGKSLTDAMNILFSLSGGSSGQGQATTTPASFINVLNDFYPKVQDAKNLSRQLNQVIAKINVNNIPDDQRESFLKISKVSRETETMLSDLAALSTTLNKMLGGADKKRYLLVFENNAEMRGAGGFLGSFAILDLDKGKIESLEVPQGGGYDTKGALTKLVESPKALHLLGPRWFMWDANWWPDWPTTAKKLEWFYENSDGSTVDGVIGLTPTVMENLLRVIGPIDLTAEYGVTVTAENFWSVTQSITESDEQRSTNKPKKIIGDLLKKIMDELPARLNKDNFLALVKALETSLNEKQALVYMNDPSLESQVERYGWEAKISQTAGDYLMVANSNIGGQKTDKVITEDIGHRAEIDAEGNIIDTLTIVRTHNGIKNEAFTGAMNVDWMRIYVPQGSTLLEASGFSTVDQSLFKTSYNDLKADKDVAAGEGQAKIDEASQTEIYNELGKTVFANWVLTKPGESSTIRLKYKLPFKLFDVKNDKDWRELVTKILNPDQTSVHPYSLLVEKQPGSLNSKIHSSLALNGLMKIIWHYPNDMNYKKTGWQIEENLNVDKYWGVIVEKKK